MSQEAGTGQSWPRSMPVLFLAALAGALIFALPLSYRQFASFRPGIILYPLLLLGFSFLAAWAMRALASHERSSPPSAPEYLLLAAACLASGHFTAWFATFGPGIVGAWRGTVLLVSLGPATISLLGALWSAYAVRLLNQPHGKKTALLVAGWIVIMGAWLFAEYSYWTFYAAGSGRHRAFWSIIEAAPRARYGLYGSIEALYWQAVWPLLWIVAVALKPARVRA